MNKSKYVFAQLIEFLNNDKFRRLVDKYDGNRYVKHLTCWNQLLALMFGQLCNRESLRDVIVALEAHRSKSFHLGLGRKPIAKTTLATANQNRDYRIFEEFAFYMMGEARQKRAEDIFKLGGKVYAFDSTTIPLCLSVFWWAKFRKEKGGVKAHVLYDLEAQVPAFYHITMASVHDSKVMKEISYETDAYYIFDRAYNNFKELYRIQRMESFFVVRAKANLQYRCVKWKRRMPKNILTDAEIELTVYNTHRDYPQRSRPGPQHPPRRGSGDSCQCARYQRPRLCGDRRTEVGDDERGCDHRGRRLPHLPRRLLCLGRDQAALFGHRMDERDRGHLHMA